jgi:hypothetical protein
MNARFGCVSALCVCVTLLHVSHPVAAIPVDPNCGIIGEGELVFNLSGMELVFDRSEGALGSLMSVHSSPGASYIYSDNPNYPGGYTFGLEMTVPLTVDMSGGGMANGVFGSDTGIYAYSLIDMENDDAVLLSGEIIGSFGAIGMGNQVVCYPTSGALHGVTMTVTGGSLQPYFASGGDMYFQYLIASPPMVMDFSQDLWAGSGSLAIYGTPEPVTLWVLLAGSVGLGLRVRRRLPGLPLPG